MCYRVGTRCAGFGPLLFCGYLYKQTTKQTNKNYYKSDYVPFFGLECCIGLLGYRMPLAKSCHGRPACQQQPTDRQTLSRTAAERPATRSPARLPHRLNVPCNRTLTMYQVSRQCCLMTQHWCGMHGNVTWSVAWPRRSRYFTRSTPWSSPYDPPVVHVLPGDTQEMVAACSSSA